MDPAENPALMDLNNKTIVVTGASRGIGKALAQQLLERGSRVAAWSRTNPEIDHPDLRHFPTDIKDMDQVSAAMQATQEHFGMAVHALVNNAGLGIFKAMDALSTEEWQAMFDVNVLGLFHATRAVIPAMKQQEGGHIINISSTAGLNGIEEASAYCGTKFAVRGISEVMYKELKRFGIKVSCIYPGAVNTDFFDHYPGITANETMMSADEVAGTIIHLLETSDNYVPLNVEMRPLRPRYR